MEEGGDVETHIQRTKSLVMNFVSVVLKTESHSLKGGESSDESLLVASRAGKVKEHHTSPKSCSCSCGHLREGGSEQKEKKLCSFCKYDRTVAKGVLLVVGTRSKEKGGEDFFSSKNFKKEDNNESKVGSGHLLAVVMKEADIDCEWLLDSGCSQHCIGNQTFLLNYKECDPVKLHLGDGNALTGVGTGDVAVRFHLPGARTKMGTLTSVLYVPNLTKNLLSLGRLIKNECRVMFDD
ncbi:hypothetical protein R1flu_021766 [Riccia fluitans]|uniref:Retrovirus-related Pol polyprotein from transposon TNT 1-94-like beta-barrel domain-containing protein n=1 Tax=Riccia fluitans TaxID=41844 RepID=A0ABD1ZQB5_9MARC